jgi:hypothetical protein
MRDVGVRHESEVSHLAENFADIVISLQVSESVYHISVVLYVGFEDLCWSFIATRRRSGLVFTASQLRDPKREMYLS